MHVARGLLRVRPVETEDVAPGGRVVLLADTRERMTLGQCEVLEVGAPGACEDEECERQHPYIDDDLIVGKPIKTTRYHACPFVVGMWLLARPRSFIAGPHPERREWFVAQDDILAILEAP